LQLNLLALQLAGNIVGRGSTNYKQTQWLVVALGSENEGAGQVVILLQLVTFFKQQV
jgi:hypothetical protein